MGALPIAGGPVRDEESQGREGRIETGPVGLGKRRGRLGWWLGLLGVTLLAAGLRLWGLEQNGTGNPYYAAAVRSMLAGPGNFFFGAFDPAGVVTVDKPPGALWIQAISAGLLGYRGWSLLLPQALLGAGCVALVYGLVARTFGSGAGTLAGLVLAITPIGVAIDRDNMPDTALVFVLLLAAWAWSRATESGRLRPLLVGAALIGVGFQIKMLAAFVVLPTFYLMYLLGAATTWRARFAHLVAATVVIAATSLAWTLIVEAVPKDRRPYIGGSRTNSAIELALGYNGLGRVFGGSGNFGPPGAGPRPGRPGATDPSPPGDAATPRPPDSDPGFPPFPIDPAMGGFPPDPIGNDSGGGPAGDMGGFPPFPPGGMGGTFPPRGGGPPGFPGGMGPGGPMGGGPPGFGGTPGPLRFTQRVIAAQITWLAPLALVGGLLALSQCGWPRSRLARRQAALVLWFGWLLTHWVVFSFAKGIFHEYYTTVMGPPIAALVGIGMVALWTAWRRGDVHQGYLPTALLLTAAWQVAIVASNATLARWMIPLVLAGTAAGIVGLVASRWVHSPGVSRALATLGATAAFACILVGPAVWSLGAVVSPGIAMMPTADPARLAGGPGNASFPPMPGGEPSASSKLLEFLRANRRGERIVLAAPSSMEVSPLIIAGESAIALGGFNGGDPVFSLEQFTGLVERGELRYVLLGGGPPGGGPGGGGMPGGPEGPGNREILTWVREHGTLVDQSLWQEEDPSSGGERPGRPGGPPGMPGFLRGMQRLYDCRPDAPHARPAPAKEEHPDDLNAAIPGGP